MESSIVLYARGNLIVKKDKNLMAHKIQKLKEEAFVDEQTTNAVAQPATQEEVAQAQAQAEVPQTAPTEEALPTAPTTEEAVAPTESEPTMVEVPEGKSALLVDNSALSTAVAMATGDVQAAELSPDVQTEGGEMAQPTTPEVAEANANTDAVAQAQAEEAPQVEEEEDIVLESLSDREKDVIREYRKYIAEKALKEEMAEADIAESTPAEYEKQMDELTDVASEDKSGFDESMESYGLLDGIYEPMGEKAKRTFNAIKEANKMDDFDALLSKKFQEGISEMKLNELLNEKGDSILKALKIKESEDFEKVSDEEFDSQEVDEDVMNASLEDEEFEGDDLYDDEELDVEDLVGDGAKEAEYEYEAEISTDDVGEATGQAVDVIKGATDFLSSLLSDIEVDDDFEDEEEVEEDFEDETLESDGVDVEEEYDLEEEPIVESRVPCKMPNRGKIETSRKGHLNSVRSFSESYNDVIYPSGSTPIEESNLVKSYSEASARRREALREYKKSLKVNSENRPNTKFREALNPTNVSRYSERTSGNSDSWNNNRFEEKYEERSKLDYKKLLEEGFLG